MLKEADSLRVARTKQQLKDAFIELYKVKTINNISVKEITNKAMFNRGTFYIHFEDIYDLLRHIEEELLAEISKIFDGMKHFDILKLASNEPSPIALELFQYFQRNSNYLEVLLGENGDPSFSNKVKNITKQSIFAKIAVLKKDLGEYSEYLSEYMSSAYVGIVRYWFKTDMKITPEELALFLSKIIIKGPMNLDVI